MNNDKIIKQITKNIEKYKNKENKTWGEVYHSEIDKLTEEQYTKAFKSVIDIYISSFKLNSYGYIENTEIYNIEAKPYNDLVNEISKLTTDLKAIQTMLGHSDISSTQVYMQFQDTGLKNMYKKAHPRA